MFGDAFVRSRECVGDGGPEPRKVAGEGPAGKMNLHALLRAGSVYASGEDA